MAIRRRQFLCESAATTLCLAAHGALATAARRGRVVPSLRLRQLRLRTRAPLDQMEHFYGDVMKLKIIDRKPDRLGVAAGATVLQFRPSDEGDTRLPWYHVAFNIPENKIVAARDWQLERTPLDNNPTAPRHADHPDIVHFAHWNAHSVFFRDPAGNLLEHIARHTLANTAAGAFTSKDILCCSEIALVLDEDDIRAGADAIGRAIGLDRYRTSSPRFVALGDENGLVLVMRRGVSLRGAADVFPTDVELAGPDRVPHQVTGYPYRISGA